MNIQSENGIGWTKVPRFNQETGEIEHLPGATWNPTAGCFHGCQWESIDGGAVAGCYAKGVAEGLAKAAYPNGFQHHYWFPDRLNEPLNKKQPHGIFCGSMGDLFGAWVPSEHIEQVLDAMRLAHWHTFIILTKHPRRLHLFNPFPPNVWVGMSLPTDDDREERGTAIFRHLDRLASVDATVRFLSAEPLWHDAGGALETYAGVHGSLPLDWIIIGAMSRGAKLYQPDRLWVETMVDVAMWDEIPIYMKSNLKIQGTRRLAEFPDSSYVRA